MSLRFDQMRLPSGDNTMSIITDKDLEKLSSFNLTRWHDCSCASCGRGLGSHSAAKLSCIDPKGNLIGTSFSPETTLGYMHWYLSDGQTTVINPFLVLKIDQVDIPTDIVQPTIVKPKIYRHECPCGLIVCDYHQVIK
jgi:hypothetical protein